MSSLRKHLGLVAALLLLTSVSSWGQGTPPSGGTGGTGTTGGTGGTGQPAAGGGGNRGNTSQTPDPSQANRDQQLPLYVEGQIINENGGPPADPVSVKLNCGMRTLQTIRTDIRGYFRFALGAGQQANVDFSAADEAPPSSILSGSNLQTGYSGFGGSSSSLTGCDIRIAVPGFVPIEHPITDPASLGVIDIGLLELRRVGTPPAGSISATSLLVPNNARKEYEAGIKDLRGNRLPQGTQHLERAVAQYDKYAAAWTELGRAYTANKEMDKARQSFQKAIAADPHYAPPYVSLSAALLEAQDYEGSLENVSKAVEIDPTLIMGVAGYVQGVANWRLEHFDAALQSLLQAEKAPHPNVPQLHIILVDLYLRQNDTANAASHMRAYIKEAPQGSFADQMRKRLADIDQAAANQSTTAAPPAVAP